MLRNALVLMLFLLSFSASAAPVELTEDSSTTLDANVRFVEDPQALLTVSALQQSDTQWQQNGASAFNQGYNESVWWLNFQLANQSNTPQFRYLELAYAVLDYIDVYIYSDQKLLQTYQMGDRYPFNKRPVENRFFVIPLQFQPGQTLDIYYRIKTSTAVQAPLEIWQRDAFEVHQNNSNIAQGFYYGAMVVIAVYNLLIFLVLLERSYLFYVGFVLALPLFMATVSGQAYRYLWPELVAWNDHAIPLFLNLAFVFGALFARRFLHVNKWSPRLNKVQLAVALMGGASVLLSFTIPYYVSIHIAVPLGFSACIIDLCTGVMAWRKQVPNARYYVTAWLAFLAGGLMFALNKVGILPNNFLTEYAMQFGSLMEAVLLSFAMAERINVERKLRFEAQDDALRVTRRLNEELELRVLERTQELETLNARLEDLSNTDQLTQLKNRRFLENVMQQEWQRCKRYGREFSVLMMDVDFFKKVNDEYGHPAGDACLKQVAERIGRCIRWPSDQVARYGGEEFCMILPETDGAGARVVAERVREMVQSEPIEAENQQFTVTLSIGVCAGVPSDQNTPENMMRFADLALYQSKQAGRNRVTLFQQEQAAKVAALPLNRVPKDKR